MTLPASWVLRCTAMAIGFVSSGVSSIAVAGETQPARLFTIDVSASSLAEALATLARQTGITIGTPGKLPALQTHAIKGRMPAEAALERLLAGTGLRAVRVRANAFRIESRPPQVRRRDAGPPPPAAIGTPIEVTALKRPELLGALPLSVFVGQPGEIELRGAIGGTDAVAGLDERVMLVGAGPGRNRIFLRGIADSPFNGPTQSTVGVMFDESRLTYSAPDPDVRLVDVARVEVIDGPQGYLHGAGAIGGLYRIVPHRPEPDRVEASMMIGASAIKDGGQGVLASGMLNLPLSGNSALRAVAYAEQIPGWIDTNSRPDTNRGNLFGLRLAWLAQLGPDWQINLGGLHQRLGLADSQYVQTAGSRQRTLSAAEPHDNDLDHLSARIEGKIGGARLVAVTSKTWHEATETYAAPGGGQAIDDRTYRTWDNEARLDGQAGALRWLAGISYVMARQNLARDYSVPAPPDGGQTFARTSHDLSAFGSLDFPVGKAFGLTVAGRLLRGTVEDSLVTATARYSLSAAKLAFSPAVTLAWRPQARDSFYLKASSGFRQGGLAQTVSGVARTDGDELRSIEFGWRHVAQGVMLEANVHHSQWRDIQSDVLLANGLVATRNIGNANLDGIDLRAEISPARGWSIRGGLYLLGTSRDTVESLDGDAPLPLSAPVQGRFEISKEVGLGEWRGTVETDFDYIGARDFFLRSPGSVRLPAQGRLGASIRLQREGMTVLLRGTNLLDNRRPNFAFGNPLTAATQVQRTALQPRCIQASLAINF